MAKTKPKVKRKTSLKPTKLDPNREWEKNIEEKAVQKPEEPKTEVSVRNVYYDGHFIPALCFRVVGAKRVPCIAGDRNDGVRLFELDAIAHDKSDPVLHGPQSLRVPYPVDRFLAFMNKLVADGAAVTADALAALQRALYPFPVARPHALSSAPDAREPLPATVAPPVRENAPGKPVQPPVAKLSPQRTDGKQLIYDLSREFGLPVEKVRAKLRASGMRAPYVDPVACRKAMRVLDPPKKARKKK